MVNSWHLHLQDSQMDSIAKDLHLRTWPGQPQLIGTVTSELEGSKIRLGRKPLPTSLISTLSYARSLCNRLPSEIPMNPGDSSPTFWGWEGRRKQHCCLGNPHSGGHQISAARKHSRGQAKHARTILIFVYTLHNSTGQRKNSRSHEGISASLWHLVKTVIKWKSQPLSYSFRAHFCPSPSTQFGM